MKLTRSFRRLRQKNQSGSSRRNRVLFEQLEPRFILSADLPIPLATGLDPQSLLTDPALVQPADAAAAPVTQTEAPSAPAGISEVANTALVPAANGPLPQLPSDPPEAEPNNTPETATFLPLDPAGTGIMLAWGTGRQDPSAQNTYWSDPDYWRIEALAGDVLSVSVDTPGSSLNPYVELRNAAGSTLASDNDAGPDTDAFISHYTITSSGEYFVVVAKDYNDSSGPGDYELWVDLARGIQLESDANYSNDSISGANALTLTTAGNHRIATVAGAVMSPEGSNTDEDLFSLGVLNTGNVVELTLNLPAGSSLDSKLILLDSTGAAVADTDGNLADGHFLGTIAADGAYYAKIQPLLSYNGHTYLETNSSLTWSQAEAYAQALGGHLATIDDSSENDWVRSNFSSIYGTLLIGYTDQDVEGTWKWADGTAPGYTNWEAGEPNNAGNENFAVIYPYRQVERCRGLRHLPEHHGV